MSKKKLTAESFMPGIKSLFVEVEMEKKEGRLYPVYITVEVDVSIVQRLMSSDNSKEIYEAIKAKITELGKILCPNGKIFFSGENMESVISTGSHVPDVCQILAGAILE